MSTIKWLLVGAATFYVVIVVAVFVVQRSLQYFPDVRRTSPAAAGLPQAEEVVLDTRDGERVIVWHVPPRPDKPVVIYFHGNGAALRERAARFAKLISDGTGLVALSYRGYGGSTGSPSEAGLIADANATYDFAVARYPADRLVAWGESLGTGVAVALAAEHPVGRLILESPFTSAAAVGAEVYPYLPVRLLMRDQFRSDERIANVTVPVLVLHGVRDAIVPIKFGERLFALIKGPKKFVRIPEGNHSDLDSYGGLAAIQDFLMAPAGGT